MTKDYSTRNSRGAEKMRQNGQKVRFWMLFPCGLDDLPFRAADRNLRLRCDKELLTRYGAKTVGREGLVNLRRMTMDTRKHYAMVNEITKYDRRCKNSSPSALAIMFGALKEVEDAMGCGSCIEDAVNEFFTQPLASRLIKAYQAVS